MSGISTTGLDRSFLLERLRAAWDEARLERIVEGYEAAGGRPVTLRANTLVSDAGEVASELDAAGIAWEPVPWYADAFVVRDADEHRVRRLALYDTGGLYLQSLSSMLPPLVLGAEAGTDVLDMCAAPGGKTSQIAALTDGGARITACELHAPRAAKLAHNLEKLKVPGVSIMRTDARGLDPFFSFDRILLDAPCTGSGTVRADDPRSFAQVSEALLGKVVRSQAALLDRALDVLKPGGTLVFATCSVLPCENEDQIARALRRHPACGLVPLADAGEPVTSDARRVRRALATGEIPTLENGLPGTATVAPSAWYEGFFVARIRRGAR